MSDFKEIEKNLTECQGYHYSQSSMASTLLRNIIFTIIGVIWVLSYKDTGFLIPNLWLYIALGFSFLYIVFDVIHYFVDSCAYRKQYFKLESMKSRDNACEAEIIKSHEDDMTKIAKRSFSMLIAKFITMILTSIVFIIGCTLHFL